MKAVTTLVSVECQVSGIVLFRVDKKVINDAGAEISTEAHRSSIGEITEPAAQFEAVDQHLVGMGFPGMAEKDKALIVSLRDALRAKIG